ncbi:polyamine aminopropyltransferase [Aquimarina brevivitae]|uniref:Polyamine aminopropyltransferase n=1 Tax=Aquimarina brevivitae TaxID=323412 RepID=A0A4Q7PHF5_9FLAO|nr:polyamine aminopropyltransferase [Aquimarina brevivitae]RZT00004.1 spermidine synthase [Aquimarina brevivitae]
MEYIKKQNLLKGSTILKIAIFATGFSGIVAEYVLSTLATYFIGDSVFQWTMIVSLMLFFMGLGARLSKNISGNLISKFLILEVLLSILVSFTSLLVYTIAAVGGYYGIVIYTLCITIGLLIGIEIPIVIRINESYQDLRTNISSVLEKDYYGSLLGGVFFGFIGLPLLGLTYTPFVLGFVNLSVAIVVAVVLHRKLQKRQLNKTFILLIFSFLLLSGGLAYTKPVMLWGEQKRYKDKVVFSKQTKYQKIVLTEWKDEHWLYLNGNLQFCSIDEEMYHEPLVHPAMQLFPEVKDVLILGGGDGCAVRELLKYKTIQSIDLVDLDPNMTDLGKDNLILKSINENSLHSDKVTIYNQDAFIFMENLNPKFYDIIIADLPDPRNVALSRLYSQEFYKICHRKLRPRGVMITQAGSPYFATKAFHCINKTMNASGFTTVPMHNQVISMGEWGWVLGVKNNKISNEQLKSKLRSFDFKNVDTKWINAEAMQLITSFGKSSFFNKDTNTVEINKINNPVLYQYYLKGNWDLY